MKLLWIGRTRIDGVGGDFVFDRKTVAACRALGHEITTIEPEPVGRFTEVARLVIGDLPYYRARFYSAAARQQIERAVSHVDAVVCSWEPYDAFGLDLAKPTMIIPHNITSQALPAIFPEARLMRLLGRQAGRYERRHYNTRCIDAIAVLSRRDKALVEAMPNAPPVCLAPPGMPPAQALDEGATLRRELVLSGTYDWRPKRRDVIALIRALAATDDPPPVVTTDPLPEEAAAQGLLITEAGRDFDWGSHLRFGVIPDTFNAGYKLKTMQFVANNCIVLSLSDVLFDFDHIEDAGLFIRRVTSAAKLDRAVAELEGMPPAELRGRFQRFKARCEAEFTWPHTAEAVMRAVAVAQVRAGVRLAQR